MAGKGASAESQHVALRADNVEFEWLSWNEDQHLGAASSEQQHAEENRHMIVQTLAGTHRAFRDVHTDLLGLDSEPVQQWWDAFRTAKSSLPGFRASTDGVAS